MPRTTDNAVYNSRIAGMLTPSSLRRVRFVFLLILPTLLLAASGWGQSRAAAEEHLAAKIVGVIGQGTMTVDVSNRSSMSGAGADDIRRELLTHLASLGARFVNAEMAGASVRVAISENLQNYVLVAEIRLSSNQSSGQDANDGSPPRVVMVSLPRPEAPEVQPDAAAMVLHKTSLWSQSERILDVAVIEGTPAQMLVLDSSGVTLYRLRDGRWQVEQSLAITHSRPWPRDLRGRIELRQDHLFDAYLPGVFCRSATTSPLGMTCYESDNAWPIGTHLFNLNAAFVSSRNYFSGALVPGVGKQSMTAPFYSAAAFPRGEAVLWLFTAVDGHVHVLDGATDQVMTDQSMEKLGWGSEIAAVRSGCGSGWQVLATGNGQGTTDTLRAFEVPAHEPVAASAPLEIAGRVTALWTESGETGAVVVASNPETGGYEAFRLNLICGR